MEPGMAAYIWEYHRRLMTEVEQKAWRHRWLTSKRPNGPYTDDLKEKFLTDDTAALELAALDFPIFMERIVNRIWAENSETLEFHRCPKCKGICRTPKAQQCRFCHHDWH